MSSFIEQRAVARSDLSLTFFKLISGHLALQQILNVSDNPDRPIEKICLAISDRVIVQCGEELITYKLCKSKENITEFIKSDKVLNLRKLCSTRLGRPSWIRCSPMNNYLYMYFDNLSVSNYFVYQVSEEAIIFEGKSDRSMRPNNVVWSDDDNLMALTDEKSIYFWQMPSAHAIMKMPKEEDDVLFIMPTVISANPAKCVMMRVTQNGRQVIRFDVPLNKIEYRGLITERRSSLADSFESSHIYSPSSPNYFFEAPNLSTRSLTNLYLRCGTCLRFIQTYEEQEGVWWSPARPEFIHISLSKSDSLKTVLLGGLQPDLSQCVECQCKVALRPEVALLMEVPIEAPLRVNWANDGNTVLICEIGDSLQNRNGRQIVMQRLADGTMGMVAKMNKSSIMTFAGDFICDLELSQDSHPRHLQMLKRDGTPIFSMIHNIYLEVLWI